MPVTFVHQKARLAVNRFNGRKSHWITSRMYSFSIFPILPFASLVLLYDFTFSIIISLVVLPIPRLFSQIIFLFFPFFSLSTLFSEPNGFLVYQSVLGSS